MDDSITMLLIALPIFMIIGVWIGLREGKNRRDALVVEIQRAVMHDMTRYLREAKPVGPPPRQISEGAFVSKETEISEFRSFMWNVYMKDQRK